MPPQDQVDARLPLPDMRHFVDEQALVIDMAVAEILAVQIALRMKPDVPVRRHRNTAWLEKGPFPVVDADAVIIDGVAKN